MHGPVPKVLPSIDNQDRQHELEHGHDNPVETPSNNNLPVGKGRNELSRAPNLDGLLQPRVAATSQHAGHDGMLATQLLGPGWSVETKSTQEKRDRALSDANSLRPECNVVCLLTGHIRRLKVAEQQAEDSLDDLLEDDIAKHLVAADMVSFEQLSGRVESVLREQVVNVYDVEGERHGPVRDDGQREREILVGYEGKERLEWAEVVWGQRRELKGRRIHYGGFWWVGFGKQQC